MKAIIVKERGGPEQLTLAEVPEPVPGPGELLLEVKATALNRADLLQRRGLYPPPPGASELLGLECAGTVLARGDAGPGAGATQVGARVMALLPGGGYAERVVIPESLALPIPEGLTFEQAAAIPEAFLTAQEALFTLGGLEAGMNVLIHAAAGGVGSAAVQLARAKGATVFGTVGSAEKAPLVERLGAQHVINYKEEDFVAVIRERTGKRLVDLVVDFIGASYWARHVDCLASGGRCVVVGVLGGSKAEVDFSKVLFKRLQLLGLVMRSRSVADKARMAATFARDSLPGFGSGGLVPVIDRVYPMAEAAEAHRRMEANLNQGKIVLKVAD